MLLEKERSGTALRGTGPSQGLTAQGAGPGRPTEWCEGKMGYFQRVAR